MRLSAFYAVFGFRVFWGGPPLAVYFLFLSLFIFSFCHCLFSVYNLLIIICIFSVVYVFLVAWQQLAVANEVLRKRGAKRRVEDGGARRGRRVRGE